MAGASRAHDTLTFNLAGLLHARLQPPCQGFVADMKVRIRAEGCDGFYYPDLLVQYVGEFADDDWTEQPTLIVEVISPATERVDKHEKRLNYQRLPSLEEYLLVHQDIRELWLYRRARQWQREVHVDGVVRLESVGVDVAVDELYRGVGV